MSTFLEKDLLQGKAKALDVETWNFKSNQLPLRRPRQKGGPLAIGTKVAFFWKSSDGHDIVLSN